MGGGRERIQPVKRPLALLGAVIVLCAAWLGSRAVESNRAGTVKREAARGAETAGMRAADALAAHVRELKLEAQNAATNPRLVAALRGNADAATLQDLFRTEEWWEPYRNAFRVYAIAFDSDKLDVIEGMKTAEFASDLIIREARERKEAVAELVMGKGWPYAAAAAGVELPGRQIPAVLVLAKPIDDAAVRKLAEKARGGVLLSDGTRAVIEAGPEPERELLRAAVGSETRGPIYESKDGTWAAAVSPLVPGLWLWTFASGAAAAHEAESSATGYTVGIWVGGLPGRHHRAGHRPARANRRLPRRARPVRWPTEAARRRRPAHRRRVPQPSQPERPGRARDRLAARAADRRGPRRHRGAPAGQPAARHRRRRQDRHLRALPPGRPAGRRRAWPRCTRP